MTVLGTRIMMPQQRGWNKHEGAILLDDLTFLSLMEQLFVETLKKDQIREDGNHGLRDTQPDLTKAFLLVMTSRCNTSTTVVCCQYCRPQANRLQVDCLFTFLSYVLMTNILLHLNKCIGFTIRRAFLGNLKGGKWSVKLMINA